MFSKRVLFINQYFPTKLNARTVHFQTIQFGISTFFFSWLNVKNSSMLKYSV